MAERSGEISPAPYARAAGLLALASLVAGSFSGYVYSRLIVPGDAATTASNILASETLFRAGFVSGLVLYTVFIFYVWVLYRLLQPVDAGQAGLMALLGLVGVPIALLNQVHQAAAWLLLSGADYLKVLAPDQLQAQAMFFLDLSQQGGLVGAIFWGLWLFPLGYLVFKSGFFPRTLGVLLMIGCFGWLTVVLQRFLLPDLPVLGYARYAAHVAELSWMLWLLIRGVNVERWNERVHGSRATHGLQ